MNVTLYTIGCPSCKVLERKLEMANLKDVDFNVVDDHDTVINKGLEAGIKSAPLLEVDGKVMDFSAALKWLKELN